jgi:hypothetical protein
MNTTPTRDILMPTYESQETPAEAV